MLPELVYWTQVKTPRTTTQAGKSQLEGMHHYTFVEAADGGKRLFLIDDKACEHQARLMQPSLRIVYIGHATVLLEMDGLRILTDPLLRNRVAHLRRFRTRIDPESYENIDVVLVSHLHLDHLDLPSLRRLGSEPRLIVPQGAAALLHEYGFSHSEELRVGQSITIGSLTITATFAQHNGFRFPFGPLADCLGFLIKGTYHIYFAGDTDLFNDMDQLGDDLDIALLPVWGWGPTAGMGHLDPYRAARALTLLQPRLAVPIHWGTMCPVGLGWMNPIFLTNPPIAFVRYANELAPNARICVVPPSSSIKLEGDAIHAPI